MPHLAFQRRCLLVWVVGQPQTLLVTTARPEEAVFQASQGSCLSTVARLEPARSCFPEPGHAAYYSIS